MSIIHVVNTYVPDHAEEAARIKQAALTWKDLQSHYANDGVYRQVFQEEYGRDSKSIGDDRPVPFIKDILRSAEAGPDDIVLLTNCDSGLVVETVDVLVEWFSDPEQVVGWSSRVDIDKPQRTTLTRKQASERGIPHKGMDLLAIRGLALESILADMPDTLCGREGWDIVFMLAFPKCKISPPLVVHQIHSIAFWHRFRFTNRGNLWNRSLVWRWLESNGHWMQACASWKGVAAYRVLPEHKEKK